MTPLQEAKHVLGSPLTHYDEPALRRIIEGLVVALEEDPRGRVPLRVLWALAEADPRDIGRMPTYLRDTVRAIIRCAPLKKLPTAADVKGILAD